MDDFDPNEEYQEEEYSSDNSIDLQDAKDKYDKLKEKIEKRKGNGSKGSNSSNSQLNNANAGKDVGNVAGKESAKNAATQGANVSGQEAANLAASTGAKAATQEGAKAAASTGTKVVAQEGAKVAASTGAKVAVEGAVSSTGVGVLVAIGIEVFSRLMAAAKKAREKADAKMRENTGVDSKTVRRLFTLGWFLIPFIIFIIIMVSVLSLFLASETQVTDLKTLIARREKLYQKKLLLFSKKEYNDIIFGDHGKEDPGYVTMLKDLYGGDYDSYFSNDATPEDSKDKDKVRKVSGNTVKEYLQAEAYNFNKINWNVVTLSGSKKITADSPVELEEKPKKDDWDFNTDTTIKVPNLDTYNIMPGESSKAKAANTYVSMLSKYMQRWIIPYAIQIDAQNTKWVKDRVMGEMYHKVDVNLYQIRRQERVTVRKYYLQVTVIKKQRITYYHKVSDGVDDKGIVSYHYEAGQSVEFIADTFHSDTSAYPLGTSHSSVEGSPSSGSITETWYEATMIGGGVAAVREGKKMQSGATEITIGDPYVYKYVPKIIYAQNFYDVTTSKYRLVKLDLSVIGKASGSNGGSGSGSGTGSGSGSGTGTGNDKDSGIKDKYVANGQILIVNKKYGLSKDIGGVDDEANRAYIEMESAFPGSSDGSSIALNCSYRSFETQQSIWDSSVVSNGLEMTQKTVAPVGHSEHHTGLAFDTVGVPADDDTSYGSKEAGIWLAQHAHEYGFIIRYPAGKESITGYSYEPWHLRYLGKEWAKKIYESGKCLEEYFADELKD